MMSEQLLNLDPHPAPTTMIFSGRGMKPSGEISVVSITAYVFGERGEAAKNAQ
jgi:hypothetical protein